MPRSKRFLARAAAATAVVVASMVLFAVSAAAVGTVTAGIFLVGEGVPFAGTVATYNGTCLPVACTATIDWGDATTSAGVVSGSGTSWQISGTHTYLEDGAYTTTVTVSDNGSTPVGTGTANVLESDIIVATAGPLTSPEATAFTGAVATFTDPGSSDPAGSYAATIAWGDGTTTSGTITGTPTLFTVTGTHTYADEGPFTITVTVVESNSSSVTTSAIDLMTVTDTDALALVSIPIPPVEGTFSGPVATLTDVSSTNTASDLVGTISWGDATTSAAVISGGGGTFTVTGTHTYLDEGIFTVVVTVADDAPGVAAATATQTVSLGEGDAFTVAITNPAINEGALFTGAIATLTDTNSAEVASDLIATVDWGDGVTTAGVVAGGSGSFTVSGPHLYAEQGTHTVVVTVTDDLPGAASATATGTVTISDPPLSGTLKPPAAVIGVALTNIVVASFTDPSKELPSAYTATINWGDGVTTTGTVTDPPGTVLVSGSHTYAAAGTHTLTVTLVDNGGPASTVSGPVSVSAGLPAAAGPAKPLPFLPLGLLCLSVALLATAVILRRRPATNR